MAFLAILTPGTGFFEIGAFFALLLAAWGAYNLPINLWALGLLLISVIPFVLAVRQSGNLIFLAISILLLMTGSAFLFDKEGWAPAVNPLLALVVSVSVAGFFWLAFRKSLEAVRARPTHDLSRLMGAIGEAKTNIYQDGSAQVAGELWTARSENPIPQGAVVRVVGREGFILIVEQVE